MGQFKTKRFLITGATGTIGQAVIRHCYHNDTNGQVVAAARNPEKARTLFSDMPNLAYASFDFERPQSFGQALQGVDGLFLLRPPHLADVDRCFKPLLEQAQTQGLSKIIFLSVQGAEKSKAIPHNKIESLIRQARLDYIFLRPSYFMQNLTTTLADDIKRQNKIALPAGKAKFNWIDADNIGEATAVLWKHFDRYKNRAYELTGYENKSFREVAGLLRDRLKRPVRYDNTNPIRFFGQKRKQGMPTGLIMVMIMLHFLPRFQKAPRVSELYEKLTGKKPTTLAAFIEREKDKLCFETSQPACPVDA